MKTIGDGARETPGRWARLGLGLVVLLLPGGLTARAGDAKGEIARGRALFLREWIPDDPRSHGGDGLGPVYNDSSCVACHNLGETGGAGPASKNVQILSAFRDRAGAAQAPASSGFGRLVRAFVVGGREGVKREDGAGDAAKAEADVRADIEAMARIHAGFRAARSVVVHHFGVDPAYQVWRTELFGGDTSFGMRLQPGSGPPLSREDRALREIGLARFRSALSGMQGQPQARGDIQLLVSRRNTPPLFGAGRIDAIPDAAIEAAAKRTHPGFPEVKGRVSRLKGGRIGRFGWKGQTADLREFVLTACAVELGLEVPGHSQGGIPNAPNYRAPGLDLDDAECADLVAFVRSLPAPSARKAESRKEEAAIRAGREAFHAAGCATCHAPKLGDVEGIYSDLLLHDMGDELSDTGQYGVFVPDSSSEEPPSEDPVGEVAGTAAKAAKPPRGATRREWRTPPLWGFRDSGPYLHDGRADTLEHAVAEHDGQAANSARRFFMLSPRERLKVEIFLKSLEAPAEIAGK